MLQPDAVIVCGEIKKQYLDFQASLVAEIISPSTELKDRNSKFSIYEKLGIAYYMILNGENYSLELYKLDEMGKYQLLDVKTQVAIDFIFDQDCKVQVDLNNIWS